MFWAQNWQLKVVSNLTSITIMYIMISTLPKRLKYKSGCVDCIFTKLILRRSWDLDEVLLPSKFTLPHMEDCLMGLFIYLF